VVVVRGSKGHRTVTPPRQLGPPDGADIEFGLDSVSNLVGSCSLVATCEAQAINPFAYLVDVLSRLREHLASRLDELLPAACLSTSTEARRRSDGYA
jgi:hypothetical protein